MPSADEANRHSAEFHLTRNVAEERNYEDYEMLKTNCPNCGVRLFYNIDRILYDDSETITFWDESRGKARGRANACSNDWCPKCEEYLYYVFE